MTRNLSRWGGWRRRRGERWGWHASPPRREPDRPPLAGGAYRQRRRRARWTDRAARLGLARV